MDKTLKTCLKCGGVFYNDAEYLVHKQACSGGGVTMHEPQTITPEIARAIDKIGIVDVATLAKGATISKFRQYAAEQGLRNVTKKSKAELIAELEQLGKGAE